MTTQDGGHLVAGGRGAERIGAHRRGRRSGDRVDRRLGPALTGIETAASERLGPHRDDRGTCFEGEPDDHHRRTGQGPGLPGAGRWLSPTARNRRFGLERVCWSPWCSRLRPPPGRPVAALRCSGDGRGLGRLVDASPRSLPWPRWWPSAWPDTARCGPWACTSRCGRSLPSATSQVPCTSRCPGVVPSPPGTSFGNCATWGATPAAATWSLGITGLLATATLGMVGAAGVVLTGGATGSVLQSAAVITATALGLVILTRLTRRPGRLLPAAGFALRLGNRVRDGAPHARPGATRLTGLLADLAAVRPSPPGLGGRRDSFPA